MQLHKQSLPRKTRVCEKREGREGGQENSVDEQEPAPERTGGPVGPSLERRGEGQAGHRSRWITGGGGGQGETSTEKWVKGTIQRCAHTHNISVYFRIYHRKIMMVACKLTLPHLF